MAEEKTETKSEKVSLRVSKERYDTVAAYAEHKGMTISDAADKLLDTAVYRLNALAKYARKQKKVKKAANKEAAAKEKTKAEKKTQKTGATEKKPRAKKTPKEATEAPAETTSSQEAQPSA